MEDEIVKIYVCPTKSCDNYYGSNNMGIMEAQENITFVVGEGKKSRGFRTKCPQCGADRVPRFARLIPEDEVDEARKKVLSKSGHMKPATTTN